MGLREGGGNCLKYLKRMEWKRGEGKQRFKKGGQVGSGGGCLKKRGGGRGWNPVTNYAYFSKLSQQYICLCFVTRGDKFDKIGAVGWS